MLSAFYEAPLEVIIGAAFLYQYVPNQASVAWWPHPCNRLLGFSAFVGFFVLVIGWPLNSYLAKRSIRIQKGLLAARDKRMGVVSELIGAVRSIKAVCHSLIVTISR